MKTVAISTVLLASAMSSPVMAISAGRVLALAGMATIERAGQQLVLAPGMPFETKDLLVVGEKSTLQVRFTDDSVVALWANSQFKIENYQFDKNTETDRSLFGLLKGRMRTITGLIGKANQKSYLVQTATSTISIRGTNFTLVACNNDCIRPDGAAQANGTYGGVSDGQITVSNLSGSKHFGQQASFTSLMCPAPQYSSFLRHQF